MIPHRSVSQNSRVTVWLRMRVLPRICAVTASPNLAPRQRRISGVQLDRGITRREFVMWLRQMNQGTVLSVTGVRLWLDLVDWGRGGPSGWLEN